MARGADWRKAVRDAIAASHKAQHNRRGKRRPPQVTGVRIPAPEAPPKEDGDGR